MNLKLNRAEELKKTINSLNLELLEERKQKNQTQSELREQSDRISSLQTIIEELQAEIHKVAVVVSCKTDFNRKSNTLRHQSLNSTKKRQN